MAINIAKEKEKNDNVYAYNVKDDEVFIRDVERGRKGYFCLGCKREMQAVHSDIDNRKWFFRHDVKAMKGQPKCTYSDETYRHKLAKLVLLDIKKIKVPAVYKFPPKGVEGKAKKIADSCFVEAFFVEQELSFYEDKEGKVNYSKAINIDESDLLIRPDITFFDSFKNPILLIELVATHKLTEEKKLKLKHLGINTVQVTVPKDSPEAIREVFFTSHQTKWIYNYEQESTEYISISEQHSEGVSPADEIQRKFFEESFKCRAAQIRNLLCSIENCLESEQYRAIKRNLDESISRVKENTKREREELGRIQDKRKGEVESEFGNQHQEHRAKREGLRKAEDEFQQKIINLEGRYFKKRDRINFDIAGTREYITEAKSRLSAHSSLESIGEDIEQEKRTIQTIERDIDGVKERIQCYHRERDELEAKYEELSGAQQKEIEGLINKEIGIVEEQLHNIRNQPAQFEENKRKEQESFEREARKLEQNFEEKGRELEHEFEDRNKQILREIEKGEVGKYGALSHFIEEGINALQSLSDIAEVRRVSNRYDSARKAIREGTYKNWHD